MLSPVVAALAPRARNKVLRSFAARAGVVERWERACRETRDYARPLVWFHASSVGEGLQARPVMQALRAAHPEWQQAYSWFSPSAQEFGRSLGADVADYLPFDTARAANRLLNALRPSLLVFSKLDVWPQLVLSASERGLPVAMISATVAKTSGRGGFFARSLLVKAYASLRAVGAIDQANAGRMEGLGVARSAISVTGDTRFDQVWDRAQRAVGSESKAAGVLRLLASDRFTLVAGSTWPSDEAPLFKIWERIQQEYPDARLIIAPHEPSERHLQGITDWARKNRLILVRLSALEGAVELDKAARAEKAAASAQVVLVDSVGVLGDLYSLAGVAWVGGGFHAAGLHSVIEPAAFGVPVMFGPQFESSREAGLLLEAGAAVSGEGDVLERQLASWISNDVLRVEAGRAALEFVKAECGATSRSVELLARAIGA